MKRISPLLWVAGTALLAGCVPVYELEGTASGLTGTLVISDGIETTITLDRDGHFSFSPASYKKGQSYQVVIEQQPAGLTCRVGNDAGTFSDASIRNVEIICGVPDQVVDACASSAFDQVGSFQLQEAQIALSTGLGASGFSYFDADDDGYLEMLFGSGNGYGLNTGFAIYEYDPEAATYKGLCSRNLSDTKIHRIAPFQNDFYNAASMVAYSTGKIEVINHRSGKVIATLSSQAGEVLDLASGDVDRDGVNDIVVAYSNMLKVYDANEFSLKKQLNYGAESIALGSFTERNRTLVATNRGLLLDLNEEEPAVIWDYTVLGFSDASIRAADIDNDGLAEIVAVNRWSKLRVFNADTRGILWEQSPSHDVGALHLADVTSDGIPEVLYGDGQWGEVYALDGKTGALLWSVDNPEHGVTDILVADLDSDKQPELVWGAGHTSSGPDYLYVHDIVSNSREWFSGETAGPYHATAFGDIDGDGVADRVFASEESQSGSGDGIVTVIASSTGEVLWRTHNDTFGGTWTGVHDLAVFDINGDGVNDVLVGASLTYDGAVFALDGVDGSLIKTLVLESGSPIYSLAISDINSDGRLEILAGGGMEHTGANGVFVYVIDAESFTLSRKLPSLSGHWDDIWSMAVVDFDADGQQEILAVQQGVYVIDTKNNGINRSAAMNFTAVTTAGSTAYAADGDGNLVMVAQDASTVFVQQLCANSITALEAISADRLAFTCGGRLGVVQLSTNAIEWQQAESLDPKLGRYDTLRHAVIDGRNTLLVGGSTVYWFVE